MRSRLSSPTSSRATSSRLAAARDVLGAVSQGWDACETRAGGHAGGDGSRSRCEEYTQILLFFKGFQALQAYRVANALWLDDRKPLALLLQSRISEIFHVDIHPGATIGEGVMLDHATGVVIGETAVVGDNVSILHGVTLGGTGVKDGDRHPKIGDGVVIGAGVTILGNIRVGANSKIGAGSVVLKEIPRTARWGSRRDWSGDPSPPQSPAWIWTRCPAWRTTCTTSDSFLARNARKCAFSSSFAMNVPTDHHTQRPAPKVENSASTCMILVGFLFEI